MPDSTKLTYEETELLIELLENNINAVNRTEIDPQTISALYKLTESKRTWYSKKSHFSPYDDSLELNGQIMIPEK